jgi:hypothetical protein
MKKWQNQINFIYKDLSPNWLKQVKNKKLINNRLV